MNPAISTTLNVLRALSALGVVFVHMGTTGFSSFPALPPQFGHFCVVIFFILSGYVIAYTTAARHRSGADYAVARLSRIYSVLLPALALSAGLLVLGRTLDPEFYQRFDRGHEPLRFALSFLNLQETWWLSAAPPTNSPLWSLAYEFWFYVAFGIHRFVPTRAWRYGLLAAWAVVVGPKILLLLPVWLLGVAAYQFGERVRCPVWPARVALTVLCAGLALTLREEFDFPGRVGSAPFYFSNAYGSDLLRGLGVALAILLMREAFPALPARGRLASLARAGADASFSLYVLHHPILVFLAAAFAYDRRSWLPAAGGLVVVLAVTWVFSAVTEKRRHLLTRRLERWLPGRRELARARPAPHLP